MMVKDIDPTERKIQDAIARRDALIHDYNVWSRALGLLVHCVGRRLGDDKAPELDAARHGRDGGKR